jgi:ABC-2 type transport system permease protein
LLNWVQLAFMLVVGRWVVPALGGDALNLDISWAWFVVMVLATSTAAIGLALLIAASTRTFDHAAALGSGLNVVLAAIAGVMVPRMLMPPGLQRLSASTPMGWALDGMQSIFLGSPEAGFMLSRAGLLFAFGAICLAAGAYAVSRRLRR